MAITQWAMLDSETTHVGEAQSLGPLVAPQEPLTSVKDPTVGQIYPARSRIP